MLRSPAHSAPLFFVSLMPFFLTLMSEFSVPVLSPPNGVLCEGEPSESVSPLLELAVATGRGTAAVTHLWNSWWEAKHCAFIWSCSSGPAWSLGNLCVSCFCYSSRVSL